MKFLDTLQNLVSGLGTSKDKSSFATYVLNPVNEQVLMNMYRGDWIARKGVDLIPEDMTRAWRNWKASKEQIEALEKVERSPTINLPAKIKYAMQLGRLLGGAVMYFGIKNQRPETPLNLESVRKGDLQYVHVWSKLEVGQGPLIEDIGNPFYGTPEYYTIGTRTGKQIFIHHTRIIRFLGAPRPDILGVSDGWSDSVLQVAYDAVTNASSSQQHVASLIPEAKTDVMYIPGLGEMLSTEEGTAALTKRFGYAANIKSMFNMVLLDGTGAETSEGESVGETWEQKQIRFADIPDLLTHYLQSVSGAFGVPLTRFLGVSPAGLNATGESDLRQYYDTLGAKQTTELGPALSALDEVVIRSALGSRPPSVYYEWAPLWVPTEVQKSEIFAKKTAGVKALSETRLIPAEALSDALVNMLIEDGSLPGLEASIEEFGRLSDQDEDVKLLARGTTPEPEAPTGAAGAGAGRPARGTGATRVAAANDVASLSAEEAAVHVLNRAKVIGTDAALAEFAKAVKDATPRSLYVQRKLINADEFLRWAKSQGFSKTLDASDIHVTVLYSRAAVDWMQMGDAWGEDAQGRLTIQPGGARIVEPLGDKGAVVLLFNSSQLAWRHREMIEKGASHDWDDYQPHVTITYDGSQVDLSKVEPYRGKLVFGPEEFSELDLDWASKKGLAA
jgi:phage-related protein (TIGR01555 family)